MSQKYQRFFIIFTLIFFFGGIALFIGITLKTNIRFFVTPSQFFNENLLTKPRIRIGGVVKKSSIQHKGFHWNFIITDHTTDLFVFYQGLMPELFREDQTVVIQGEYNNETKVFLATQVLAKHDENYRPPEKKE